MALFLQGPNPTTPPPHAQRSEPFIFNDLPIFPFRLLTSFDSSPRSVEPDHELVVDPAPISAISDSDDDRIGFHSPPRAVSISSPLPSSSGPCMGSPFQNAAVKPPTPSRDSDADDKDHDLSPISGSPHHPSSPQSPDAMVGTAPAEVVIPVFGEDDGAAPPTNPEGSPERPLVPTNAADWEAKKDIIQELYMDKNLILNDVVNIMLSTHNFKATYVFWQFPVTSHFSNGANTNLLAQGENVQRPICKVEMDKVQQVGQHQLQRPRPVQTNKIEANQADEQHDGRWTARSHHETISARPKTAVPSRRAISPPLPKRRHVPCRIHSQRLQLVHPKMV